MSHEKNSRYTVLNPSNSQVVSSHRLLTAAKRSARVLANAKGRTVEVFDHKRGQIVALVEHGTRAKRRRTKDRGFFGGIFG